MIKDLSIVDMQSTMWEYKNKLEKGAYKDIKELKDKLRQICSDAGLIHKAEKRWAGQDFDPLVHDDSRTKVDLLIDVIVAEYMDGFRE